MSARKNRSRHNIPGTTQTRLRPGGAFIHPAGVQLRAARACKAQPLARTRPYCKVALLGVGDVCLSDCVTLTEPHRCYEDDIVVVPDLAFLHDVDRLAADEDLAVSFLYIVALGVDTTTQANLAVAQGVPQRLTPQLCVRHAAAMERTVYCSVNPRLALVQKALKRISRAAGSNFAVARAYDPASGGIVFSELR